MLEISAYCSEVIADDYEYSGTDPIRVLRVKNLPNLNLDPVYPAENLTRVWNSPSDGGPHPIRTKEAEGSRVEAEAVESVSSPGR